VSSVTPRSEWLALGEASRLLGVDGDTLRRWADQGRLESFTTPGGHRRFRRTAIERLVTSRRTGQRPPLARLGATPERVQAAYRRSYGARTRWETGAHADVEPIEREAFRQDGRRIVDALLRFLDADMIVDRMRAEAEAAEIAADLGTRLAGRNVPLSESVGFFVAARRPFLGELSTLARRRSLDAPQLGSLYEAASGLLDRLLVRFVEAHQAVPVRGGGTQ